MEHKGLNEKKATTNQKICL